MNVRIGLMLVLLLLLNGSIRSQPIFTRNLTMDDGLSSNYVRTLYSDSQGFLWFGTEVGLDRFDGRHIVSYAKRFDSPLKGAVQSIEEFGQGRLLVGTSWGAFLYDVHRNKTTPIRFNRPSIDVRSVLTTTKGRSYFATDEGLFELDTVALNAKQVRWSNVVQSSLSCLTEDEQGTLWMVGAGGLFKLVGGGVIVSEIQEKALRVVTTRGDKLYIGSSDGLMVYDVSRKKRQRIPGLEGLSILTLTWNDKGKLFVGTDNAGVYVFDSNMDESSVFRAVPRLANKSVFSLLVDPNGMLWIGTFDSGLHFLNLKAKKVFETIEFENSGNANIRSLYLTKQGEKYVGTRKGELFCLDASNRVKSVVKKRFRSDILTTIHPLPGKPEVLLIGTYGGGVTVFDTKNNRCSNLSNEDTFINGTVYKFCEDKQQHLWIASLNGLYRYDLVENRLTRFDPSPATGSKEVFSVCFDGKDRIWAGTKTGVCFYSLKKGRFEQPPSCKTRRFQCTATFSDSKGNAWFCFNKGGVLKLDGKLNEALWLDKELGLPENAPSSIVVDRSGFIWIGSSKGLFRIRSRGDVQAFGLEDGLTGVGICPESATMDKEGRLWWSNEVGLVSLVNPRGFMNERTPNLVVATLTINGKLFDADTLDFVTKTATGRYRISIRGRNNNNLAFGMASLDFTSYGRERYSTFLEGVDTRWSEPKSDPTAAYEDLKPGRYVLKVRLSDHDAMRNSAPLEIDFSITPYFYETAWFLVLALLAVMGLLLFFTRRYIHRFRIRMTTQLGELKSRTSPASNLSRISDEKLDEIKADLLKLMSEEKPWLNSSLRQAEVAAASGRSVHEISQLLNVQMNQHFQDFINSYRVEEVKARIQRGETHKYTLTAIALQSGFSAKSSFQRAFKKATGLTPSDYLKSQGLNSTPDTNKPS